jgi:hypothetical protein
MSVLKPKHNWLRGVEITTLDHKQKKLLFLCPRLGPAGDKCRKAMKDYEEHEKKKLRWRELSDKNEKTEAEVAELAELQKLIDSDIEQDLLIKFAIASLQQQYDLFLEEKEAKPQSDDELEKVWKAAFEQYFCEQDPLRILISVRTGGEFTQSDLYDTVVKKTKETPKNAP